MSWLAGRKSANRLAGITVMGAVLVFLAGAAAAALSERDATRTMAFRVGPVHIKGRYEAMSGPVETRDLVLSETGDGDGIWIKGFSLEAEVDGRPASLRYLCHAWLDLGGAGSGLREDQRLLTISQGMAAIRFPDGYGIPTTTGGQSARLQLQALSEREDTDIRISYAGTVSYLSDAAARELGLRPLRTITVLVEAADAMPFGLALLKDASGTICSSGGAIGDADPTMFRVPPGRHTYRSRIARDHPIHKGVTIRAIKAHLHEFGERIALQDRTTGRTVWEGRGVTDAASHTLISVDGYSDATGLQIDPSHAYEIETTYNNTATVPISGMAVLRLYVSDNDLDAPRSGPRP